MRLHPNIEPLISGGCHVVSINVMRLRRHIRRLDPSFQIKPNSRFKHRQMATSKARAQRVKFLHR